MGVQQSLAFPYEIGPVRVPAGTQGSIWSLHSGTKKSDGSSVSIFAFDLKNASKLIYARNALKRFKTFRHPNILPYVDGAETAEAIYVVTAEVTPLDEALSELRQNPATIGWGLYQITRAVAFINQDCNLVHGNVRTATIYVTKAGDWRLGGLEIVGDANEADALIRSPGLPPDLPPRKYRPPEFDQGNWQAALSVGAYAIDVWMLGCLIFELYSGVFQQPSELKTVERIPAGLRDVYLQIFSFQPKGRPEPRKLLDSCPFFSQSAYIQALVFLEAFAIKDASEKDAFFRRLDKILDEFPPRALKFKVLPQLVHALDFGGAGARVLAPIMKIATGLNDSEFSELISPSILKWFGANDRAMRMGLLQQLDVVVPHLSDALACQVFGLIENGFSDTFAGLRELTLRSMIILAPKLSEKLVNENLAGHLTRMQTDPEAGIRTNAVICLTRLSSSFSAETQTRLLAPAFAKSLKDPFPYARVAALSGFIDTMSLYGADITATKILPFIAPLALDADKNVRKAAVQCMRMAVAKIEKFSEQMPDAPVPATGTPGAAGASDANVAGGGEGYLSWGFSKLTKGFYGGDTTTNVPTPSGNVSGSGSGSAPVSAANSSTSLNTPSKPAPLVANATATATEPKRATAPLALSQSATRAAPAATVSSNDGWGDDWQIELESPAPKAASSAPAPKAVASQNSGWEDAGWEDFDTPVSKTSSTSKGIAAADDGWGDSNWDFEPKKEAKIAAPAKPKSLVLSRKPAP